MMSEQIKFIKPKLVNPSTLHIESFNDPHELLNFLKQFYGQKIATVEELIKICEQFEVTRKQIKWTSNEMTNTGLVSRIVDIISTTFEIQTSHKFYEKYGIKYKSDKNNIIIIFSATKCISKYGKELVEKIIKKFNYVQFDEPKKYNHNCTKDIVFLHKGVKTIEQSILEIEEVIYNHVKEDVDTLTMINGYEINKLKIDKTFDDQPIKDIFSN